MKARAGDLRHSALALLRRNTKKWLRKCNGSESTMNRNTSDGWSKVDSLLKEIKEQLNRIEEKIEKKGNGYRIPCQ